MSRRQLFAGVYGFLLLVLVAALAYVQWSSAAAVSWGFWLTCLLAGLGLVPVLWRSEARAEPPAPQATDPEASPAVVDPRNPYRGRLRSAAAALAAFTAPVATKTSATTLSLLVGAVLCTASLLVSALLRWPVWLEVELIVGCLWVLATGIFTALLWRGSELADDRMDYGLAWTAGEAAPPFPDVYERPRDVAGMLRLALPGSHAGCIIGVVIGLALFAAWLVLEVLLPAVFLLLYFTVFASAGSVLADRHACRGRPVRALMWGSLWATLYLGPLAVTVALVGHTLSLATR